MGNLQLKFFTEGMFPYGGCFHERVYVLCYGSQPERSVFVGDLGGSRCVISHPSRLNETLQAWKISLGGLGARFG